MIQRPVANAFTLIELLVVISIIVILIAMLVPALEKAQEMAFRAKCGANSRVLGYAVIEYSTDNKGTMPPVWMTNNQLPINHWSRWFYHFGYQNTQQYANLGFLWRDQYVTGNGEAFFCPSQSNIYFVHSRYDTPSFPYAGPDRTPNPELANGDSGVRIHYYYLPQTINYTSRVNSEHNQRARLFNRRTDFQGRTILIADSLEGVNVSGTSIAHRPNGWNIMRHDLSVHFTVSPELKDLMETHRSNWAGNNFVAFDKGLQLIAQ